MTSQANWQYICQLDDIPRQGARRVARPRGLEVALFRTAADAVYALLDYSPYKGGPLSNGKMEPTTENFDAYWAGTAYARAKFGLFVSEDDGREINFIRGFGFWREKMVGEQGKQAAEQAGAQGYAAASTGAVDDSDIDF